MTRRNAVVFRVVLAAWLFGWFVNSPGFVRNFASALGWPLDYPAFPRPLTSPRVAIFFYFLPALAAVALAMPRFARPASVLCAVSACALLLHAETGSDATFVTSFWSALWAIWFSWNADREDDDFVLHARALAQSVVGLMFLGAAIGKLTPEYLSGEAFYRLYFKDNTDWLYRMLKSELPPATVRSIATGFSRCAIAMELLLAGAPLLPTRIALGLGALSSLTMMIAWTFHLSSVLSCLLGLLVAAELLSRSGVARGLNRPERPARPADRADTRRRAG